MAHSDQPQGCDVTLQSSHDCLIYCKVALFSLPNTELVALRTTDHSTLLYMTAYH